MSQLKIGTILRSDDKANIYSQKFGCSNNSRAYLWFADSPKSADCQKPAKEIEYLTVKKPLHKSVYYQHSREGVKYWYEKPEGKTCKYTFRNYPQ